MAHLLHPAARLHTAGGDLAKQWYVTYTFKKKRYTLSVGINHLHTAEERLRAGEALLQKVISALQKGIDPKQVAANTATDKQVYQAFAEIAALKMRLINPRSGANYKAIVRYLQQYYADKYLPAFDAQDALNFKHLLCTNPGLNGKLLSRKTINNYIINIREGFEEMRRKGWITQNPCRGLSLLKQVRSETFEMYSPQQLAAFENAAITLDKQLLLFVKFIYYTCNRINSLRLLRVGDIKLHSRQIHFRAAEQKSGRAFIQPISDAFWPDVAAMNLHLYPKDFYVFGHHGQPGESCIAYSPLHRRHRAILKTCGLPDHTLYGWKHTGAVALYHAVRDIIAVKEHLNHAEIKTTMIYLQRYNAVFGSPKIVKNQLPFGQ